MKQSCSTTLRALFPGNLVAGLFQFQPARLLEIEAPQQRQAPEIAFRCAETMYDFSPSLDNISL
jgi:hypothetical protein